jgi:hypothetical protein
VKQTFQFPSSSEEKHAPSWLRFRSPHCAIYFKCRLYKIEEMQILTFYHCATLVSSASPLLYFWNNVNLDKLSQALEGQNSISVSTRITLFMFLHCAL